MQNKQRSKQECVRRIARRMAALWVTAVAAWTGSVIAADTYTWSTGTTGAAVDGSGTWDSVSQNWVGAGDVHSAWNNAAGDTAAFGVGGAAGTVNLDAGGITIGGLIFNAGVTGAYTLNGGPMALTGAPVFAANADAAIGALITGPSGFVKTGAGTLTFNNPESTFAGDIGIAGGTVVCNSMNVGGTNSVLGRANLPRAITVSGSGAVLLFNVHDTFGNDGKNTAVTLSVKNGGAIRNNSSFTTLGTLNLDGSTMTSSGGANPNFQAYQLKGTVTSGGESAIDTTGGIYNGVHVYDNTFAVTGGTLTVSAPMLNKAGNAPAGFTKTGDGAMVLAADNAFSGGIAVSNGTVQVGNGGAAGTAGTGAIGLVSEDTRLVFNRTGALTVPGAVSGSGSLAQLGSGVVLLAGGNTYTGSTTVSNGVLGVMGLLTGYDAPGAITVGPGAGLTVDAGLWSAAQVDSLLANASFGANAFFGFGTQSGNATVSESRTLADGMGLLKTGPNVLTLSGNNTYSGGTAVLGGILKAGFGAGISGTTNVTLNGGTFSPMGASLTASLGTGVGQINIIPGSSSGFSAFSEPLTVSLGGAGDTLTWGSSVFNPGALVLNEIGADANLVFTNGLDLNGATRPINVHAFEAAVSGVIANGGLVKGGAGKLTLSAPSTYAGGTTINAGTLALSGGDNRLNPGGAIVLNGGTLDLGGNSQTLNNAGFAMASGTVLQNGTLTYGTAGEWNPNGGASVTFGTGGGFVMGGRLLMNGSQTLTLASGAGVTSFGGDGQGASNFIGVDNANANAVVVNGGSLNFTGMASGAGYLRIAANGGPSTGALTVHGGAVNIGHSMNMGAHYANGVAAANGTATLSLSGGEVNVGTGTDTATTWGNRGWLYLGNADAGTVSRSTVNLDGGTLSLVQFEAGAYGTNSLNFNGGTLKARANNPTFVNGVNLACTVGDGGAAIDTDGFKVGIAADLAGSGSLVKRGAGTLVLSGSNTYSGVTKVETGTLSLSSVMFANLKLRLDASEASTLFANDNGTGAITASGQSVGYWGDLSGSGKPATQATADRRPTYVTDAAGFNGLPVLQFDGVDDDITSALDINQANMPNMTLVMVYRQVAKTTNSGLWGHDDGGWDRLQLLNFGMGGAPDGYGISTGNGWTQVNGMNTDAVLIYTASFRGGVSGGSYVYINGLSDGANGLPAYTSYSQNNGLPSLTLANISPNNAFPGNIQIGEVLVFDAALSAAARGNIESYLRNKWLGGSDPVRPVLPTSGVIPLTNSVLGNLKLRLDASDILSLGAETDGSGAITASGQTVGYWADLSGNGKPATQADIDRRPTYVTDVSEFAGRPVLQFDGVNDDITSALDINQANIPNMTLMMAYRQVAKTANSGLWGHDDGGWDRLQLLNFSAGGLPDGYPIAGAGDRAPVNGMNTSGVLLYTAVLKNGVANGSYVYINGQSDSANGLPAFTSSEDAGFASLTLANISPGSGYRGNIQIGEVLVFDTVLSDDERVSVESYLRSKWQAVPGRVELADGAALDLAGGSQTLTSVSGAGTVSNGTLTVTEAFSPDGSGIGTLNVAGASLNGTLRVDVRMDGTCDQLVADGDLALAGLTLQIADIRLLNTHETYTLATCTGALNGPFVANNLPRDWHVRYNLAQGRATAYYAAPGTVLQLR